MSGLLGRFFATAAIGALALSQVVACSSTPPGGGQPGAKGGAGSSAASARGGGAGQSIGTGSGAGQTCSTPGATRGCCGTGTQTCAGTVEFQVWGPCIASKGATLSCAPSGGCGVGEFGPNCDGGVGYDGGHKCGAGEFGPNCGNQPPPPPPPPPALCKDAKINNEPEILAGYSPAEGQSVDEHGQIKVWVTDEHPAFIAPNEQLDSSTGTVLTPGDRAAKASDGYLLEPALYIAPQTAETGGTPHFPSMIKGWYNNNPLAGGKKVGAQGAPIDPPPAGVALSDKFSGEDVWDVSSLGLAPGTYIAEFVIHDGDEDRGVGCVTIVITP